MDGTDEPWPPHFPHTEIDALLERLQAAAGTGPEDAADLLLLIAREAQRLRTTVVRLAAARLSAAEREARQILQNAQESAADLRAAALEVLEARLDESDRLSQAVREALAVEQRRAPAVPLQRQGGPDRHDDDDTGIRR